MNDAVSKRLTPKSRSCVSVLFLLLWVFSNSTYAQQIIDNKTALPALNEIKESVLSPSLLQLLPQTIQSPATAPSQSPTLPMPEIIVDTRPLILTEDVVETMETLPVTPLPIQGELIPLRIILDLQATPNQVIRDLENLGMESIRHSGILITGQLPIAQVVNLQSVRGISNVRPAYAGVRSGVTFTQGDQAARADLARAISGHDGTGITIGMLSDSYDCLNQAANDINNGDLPAASSINIIDDSVCGNFVIDEGRAMFQIAHDMAPGADLSFHTAFLGELDFAAGIGELISAGADIVVDDVFYYEEPFFQDGVIAQAASDAVLVSGVPYFTAAGNAGRHSWEGSYTSSGQSVISNGDAHDFAQGSGTVDIFQQITVGPSSFVAIVLQWDDPYTTLDPNSPGPDTDLDIALLNSSGSILASGVDANIGGDPYEVLVYSNFSGAQQLDIVIEKQAGPAPSLMKWVAFSGVTATNEYDTASGTVVGHANADSVLSIGAVNYDQTPEFGVSPPILASYSSGGASEILFLADGTPTTIVRNNPDVTAPDAGNNTVVGIDTDGDVWPNFLGTSAAVVHAASVAALLLEQDSTLTPSEIESTLETTAIDHGITGYDADTGHGLIDAAAALATLLVPPSFSSPMAGSTQFGPTLQVDWQENELTPDSWQVFLGSTPPQAGTFSDDLFDSGPLGSAINSVSVTNLPEDDSSVYLTLEWTFDGVTESTTIEVFSSSPTPPILTSPSPQTSTPLAGSAVPVTWTAGSSTVDNWQLFVGTTGPQSANLFDSGLLPGSTLGTTVTGLPLDGQTLYFTLEFTISNTVQSLEYVFTAQTFIDSIVVPRGQWHLISIPAQSSQTFTDFFAGHLDPADFNNLGSDTPWIAYYKYDPNLFHPQTGIAGFYELVDLNESLDGLYEGFWLMHLSNNSIILDLPTDAIHASGLASPECAAGFFCETIPLANNNSAGGWTIGSIPSSLEPTVDDFRMHTPTTGSLCEFGCDLAASQTNGFSADFAWTYEPAVSGGYGLYIANETSDTIESWSGFFISTTPAGAAESLELEVPVR